MPLVEIIPAIQTNTDLPNKLSGLMKKWGKSPVIARDTPGFIVNRVARPFYGEALRILDEGIADVQTIDAAMRASGFRTVSPAKEVETHLFQRPKLWWRRT